MKIQAVLVGARGYVGAELISILSEHSSIDLIAASSRELDGKPVEQYSKSELIYGDLSPQDIVELSPDLVILALPNGLAEKFVKPLDETSAPISVIDLSADYRFDPNWSYALPEVHLNTVGSRISNPGCYATAIQLSVAPVKDLVDGSISCFGISGYSGAGTTPSDKNNLDLLKGNVMPYSLVNHLHEKEVSHHLGLDIKFSPHVAEYFRGISLTSHIPLKESSDIKRIKQLFQEYYQGKPLIKLQDEPPQVASSAHSHGATIGGWSLSSDGKHLALCCALDNLLKGAASQAVQNINIAFGLPQLEGLQVTSVR
ncbi:N-acetyl-gamma-glutamyl-phosphate reductase [Kangiella taiwanensis]|uniref:N-acetyl-gamma-glutamyl-phosphate reductase n=1 Tax=Kangiella taiwanensis TaxID=1079179 RepID=A0ABP8I3Z6_9GAMM|nr:N-acetyl-gamma-glutamyl-phosphate reductase [Kangiella taiwanensis]